MIGVVVTSFCTPTPALMHHACDCTARPADRRMPRMTSPACGTRRRPAAACRAGACATGQSSAANTLHRLPDWTAASLGQPGDQREQRSARQSSLLPSPAARDAPERAITPWPIPQPPLAIATRLWATAGERRAARVRCSEPGVAGWVVMASCSPHQAPGPPPGGAEAWQLRDQLIAGRPRALPALWAVPAAQRAQWDMGQPGRGSGPVEWARPGRRRRCRRSPGLHKRRAAPTHAAASPAGSPVAASPRTSPLPSCELAAAWSPQQPQLQSVASRPVCRRRRALTALPPAPAGSARSRPTAWWWMMR